MSGHTPGPWHVFVRRPVDKKDKRPTRVLVLGPNEEEIAEVCGETIASAVDDAVLIAAAPWLRASQQALFQACVAALNEILDSREIEEDTPGVTLLRAAIAKAKGTP